MPRSFALPTYAQQDVADPQTTQKVFASVFNGFDEATNNHDAAAIAAHFTPDAVFVTPEEPIIGRQAIQKWHEDLFQRFRPKNHTGKVDGNALHVIGTVATNFGQPENGVRLSKARTANPSQQGLLGPRHLCS